MALKTVQDALLTQLKADTDLVAEFGVAKIKKGLEAKFDIENAPKGVRVKALPPRWSKADMSGYQLRLLYDFLVAIYYYLPPLSDGSEDIEGVEDKNSSYELLLRKALLRDLGIGGTAADTSVGRASFEISKFTRGLYFIAFPVSCLAYEVAL